MNKREEYYQDEEGETVAAVIQTQEGKLFIGGDIDYVPIADGGKGKGVLEA